jgi:hypothetical protein
LSSAKPHCAAFDSLNRRALECYARLFFEYTVMPVHTRGFFEPNEFEGARHYLRFDGITSFGTRLGGGLMFGSTVCNAQPEARLDRQRSAAAASRPLTST